MSKFDVLVIKNNVQHQHSREVDLPSAERAAKRCFFRGAKEVRVIDNQTDQEVYRIGD